MSRGFLEVEKEYLKSNRETIIPKRGTVRSAGYDFHLKEEIVLAPNETKLIFSDIKAYMESDEVLNMYIRSSIAIKKKIRLNNCVCVIDADYFSNPDNDGNIGIALHNFGNKTIILKAGERVCQGVFSKYLIATNDDANGVRKGGIGSTGK